MADREEFATHGRVEGFTVHVLHDDEHAAVGVVDLVDLADERMIERRGGKRLTSQPLARHRQSRAFL